jgi:hypothetical protein
MTLTKGLVTRTVIFLSRQVKEHQATKLEPFISVCRAVLCGVAQNFVVCCRLMKIGLTGVLTRKMKNLSRDMARHDLEKKSDDCRATSRDMAPQDFHFSCK